MIESGEPHSSKDSTSESSLKISITPPEWATLFILVAFFALAIVVHKPPTLPPAPVPVVVTMPDQEISIFVEGAVKYPGLYHVPKGTRLKDLLVRTEVEPQAEVRGIKINSKLTKSRRIVVDAGR